MKAVYKLAFNDSNGIECSRCMLSIARDGKELCSALGIRPTCPEKGCRKDCPLEIIKEEGNK